MLIACKVPAESDGDLPRNDPIKPRQRHPLRVHIPDLSDRITQFGHLIPDTASATRYMASLPSLSQFGNWSIDHRYWQETALPLNSVPDWRTAAGEVAAMLDQIKEDGVLP
jgi:hypothetical protein